MIVTLAGAPAVGKSATAAAMMANCRTFIVPEVNKLFARPKHKPKNWYLDRQVARWEMGLCQVNNFDWIIFDGDLFQPLWFSWIFYDEPWMPITKSAVFYRNHILEERIGFPDVYFVLWVNAEERRKRAYERGRLQNRDEIIIENKIKRYERLVIPQLEYFKALQQRFPERVRLVEAKSLEASLDEIASTPVPDKRSQDIEILDFAVNWLNTHHPEMV